MDVLRYAAFSSDPAGGNRAGVVLDATGATAQEMLAVAADVGYSESAFLLPRGDGTFGVRYFSPLAEVSFCGHATIATGAAWAERQGPGTMLLDTQSGRVELTTEVDDGVVTATLVSVPPRTVDMSAGDLAAILSALRWRDGDLDPALPPRVAYGGAWHPIIAAATRERLADLDYDFEALGSLMAARGWTTVDLVWRAGPREFHARNPFPPGGVVEDPATGAAAAAFGGYLRESGLVDVPTEVTVHQGHDFGRPSLLTVGIPAGDGGISVTGTAVALPAEDPVHTEDPASIEVQVAAGVEHVWRALREPDLIARWFGWEYDGLTAEVEAIFVENVPADDGAHVLRLGGGDVLSLHPAGAHTLVRLERPPLGAHPEMDAYHEDITEGWRTFLEQLRFAVDRHDLAPRRTVMFEGLLKVPAAQALGVDDLAHVAPGTPYHVVLEDGLQLAGEVWFSSRAQLGLTVEGSTVEGTTGDGLLVLAAQPVTAPRPSGGSMLVLTTYGLDDGPHAELQTRWNEWWQRNTV